MLTFVLTLLVGWVVGVFFIFLFPILFVLLILFRFIYYFFIEPKLHQKRHIQDTHSKVEPKKVSLL